MTQDVADILIGKVEKYRGMLKDIVEFLDKDKSERTEKQKERVLNHLRKLSATRLAEKIEKGLL